jgi:hypothetical protein
MARQAIRVGAFLMAYWVALLALLVLINVVLDAPRSSLLATLGVCVVGALHVPLGQRFYSRWTYALPVSTVVLGAAFSDSENALWLVALLLAAMPGSFGVGIGRNIAQRRRAVR